MERQQGQAQETQEKLLPEGYEGVLTENDLALIRKTVGGTLESRQEAQREATAKAAEDAAVDRAGTFRTMSQGLATKFRSTYGITDEQGDAMDELLLNDAELTAAAQKYILQGEGEFPEELFNQEVQPGLRADNTENTGKNIRSRDSGGIDGWTLLAEGVKKALLKMGINPQQHRTFEKEQDETTFRAKRSTRFKPAEGQDAGENDYFEDYLKSSGMENLDPSLKMLLREMDHGTPN